MKVTEVSVGVTYKKSLPNYENITFHSGLKVSIEDGETHKKAFKDAWNIAGEEISKQLALFEEESKSGVKKGL